MEPEEKQGKPGVGLLDRVREQVPVVREKIKEDIESLKQPEKTQLYKSIFRVKHDETPQSQPRCAEQRLSASPPGQGQP
jgi:hypothetical protein